MLKIVGHPHPSLATRARDVTDFGTDLRRLVDEMAQAMYLSEGVGLAAPQVDVLQRVLIIDPSGGEEANLLTVLINPRVTWVSPKTETGEEGCLSLPGVRLLISRPTEVQVDYCDVTGSLQRRLFTQARSESRIVQHEIDHLDGIVMLDRAGPLSRKMALKGKRHGVDQG